MPINNAVGARLTSFSTIYLTKLISPSQAYLTFSIRTDVLEHEYNIDLTGLADNYYTSLNSLIDDLNQVFTSLFISTDTTDKFYTALKPTISFNEKTFKLLVQSNQTTVATTIKINSNTSNLWFKLGFPNGIYDFEAQQLSPRPPTIIPLNEIYVEIDGLMNETGRIRNVNNPTNNPTLVEVITMNNVSLGDVYTYRSSNIPEYPLHPNPYINSFNIRLLDSLGNPARLDADYRIQIDFIY
jgi:hypothetical protein